MSRDAADSCGNATSSPQVNESCNEVLTSVKESLKKVMDQRGNMVLSEILVHRFPSAAFNLQKDKLPEDEKNLYCFLMLVSKCGKSKNSNKNRSQKKSNVEQCPLVSGAKTDMDLSKVHIGHLQCSKTYEILSVKSNDVLKGVLLRTMLDEQLQGERAIIEDTIVANNILQGLDIHFLLNVLQNAMLQLTLSDSEAQVVQALRICRNFLIHSAHVPQREKLEQAARVLREALSELAQPSQMVEIEDEISTILKRLDSHNLIEELQRELADNAPQQHFLERHFTLPSGKDCSLLEMCEEVCRHEEVRIKGEVWSGRTSVLLALYQMWAQKVGPLAVHYRLILPLLQRPGSSSSSLRWENATSEDVVLHFLRQWTPTVLCNYGDGAIVSAVSQVLGSTLALCDSALGYSSGPCWTEGPRVVTDWLCSPSIWSPGDAASSRAHSRVTLVPLKSEQVETEVCSWQHQLSTHVHVLYKLLQDQHLLSCPQALNVFRKVVSKVVLNLDLEMMRAVVDCSHSWTSSSDPAADKEFFFKVAFDNILSNKDNVCHLKDRCVPAYLVGPQRGPYKFRSLYIEEYCAAMFVSRHSASAAWKWLRQPVRFQRVFTFVLQIWNEEETLQQHETVILNYLSVILGLYRMKGKSKVRMNKKWQVDRPADWTLEKEGFVREGNPKCKLWLLVLHVLESVMGNLWALERVLRHLLLYNVWILDVDRFNDNACDGFNRLCRKMVNILMRSESDAMSDIRLPIMKLNERCRSEVLNRREVLLRTMACFRELHMPLVVKVQQYYNCRDSKYGRKPLVEVQQRGAVVLLESLVPISSYVGPLVLPGPSLQLGALSGLRELRVTVYELSSVHTLLLSCPPALGLLSLNVDLSSWGDSTPLLPPPPSRCSLSPSCYVRIALRYSGSLQVLQQFSEVPQMSVLRLHGLYPPAGGCEELPPAVEGRLRVRCLVVKFVRECGGRMGTPPLKVWCSSLLSAVCASCSGVQRLIVARAPACCTLDSMCEVVQKTATVRRLVVQGTAVSVQEARRCLQGPGPKDTDPEGVSCLLQPRLPEEERLRLSRDKPRGFELIIVGVPATPLGSSSPSGGTTPTAGGERQHIRPLAALVRASFESPYTAFCYEAEGGSVEVLRSPTRDLRLHLHLPYLHDQEVQELQSPASRPLLHLLAAPQYLRLQCGALTAKGFLQLVSSVDAAKGRLTVGGPVAPFHLTVLTTQRAPCRRELERQQEQLQAELARLSCLNYAVFCVRDEAGHLALTVRKSHRGRVFCDLHPAC